MITLQDMNQSWMPPIGFDFCNIEPKGSYLVLTYTRRWAGTEIIRGGANTTTIYLNDQGREVSRTIQEFLDSVAQPVPKTKPVAARFKFWNGFLIVLQGLQEMGKCLKQ